MTEDGRGRKPHVDPDGVRIRRLPGGRGRTWLAVLAVGLLGALLFLAVRPAPDGEQPAAEPVAVPRRAVAASDVRPPAAPVVEPHRPRPVPPAVPAAVPPAAAEAAAPDDASEPPSKEDPVFGEAKPGERSGIALFPPPGTKPIKRGILVPDDFELPPGYVRHYQATDDGERVPAILMFHPDYHPVDAHGDPIALPADRVVPPEMAPPGMPIEMLELPEDQGAPAASP